MQHLERLSAGPEAAWYAIRGDFEGRVSRYVVSTPASRDVCNRPEVLGVEFNMALLEAMTASLRHAPFRKRIEQHPEERVCVVNFLRGGLNFELRRALHAAYGFNRHSSAFMSSQRSRVDGRWQVQEDMYRKLEIPRDAVLVMGDVVATGVTLENGLNVIVDHLRNIGSSARAVVFFTIGCHKAEKVLDRVDARLREAFPGYEETVLVYLEGKFRLVDSRSPLRIGIPGTDLVRRETLLAPEFARSQFDAVAWPLERCAIYDAGSRAFDIPTYVEDVLEYWEQVDALAAEGWTLRQALLERWPEMGPAAPATVLDAMHRAWRGLDPAFVSEFRATHATFWERAEERRVDTAEALAAVCRERIATLHAAGGMRRTS